MSSGPLVRLGIRVRRERAEIALAALLPLLQNGAEETEPEQDEIEYALYAPRAELPHIDDIRGLVGDALIDVTLTEVPPGWERRWHQYLRPVEIAAGGRRLRIRPPWQEPAGDPGMLEVVVDPGELFGAGAHPTTRLCLELLLGLEPSGPLCDWGAGSGILAVTAALLGFDPVDAIEVMPDGLEAIRDNASGERRRGPHPLEQPGRHARPVGADRDREPDGGPAAGDRRRGAGAPARAPDRVRRAGRADGGGRGGVRPPRDARDRPARAGRVGRRAAGGAVIRLAVRVARAEAETVLAELLELAPGGLEEREDGDAVEFVIYGAPGEVPALPDLRAAVGGALVDVSTTEIPDDWSERWKAFHRPVDVSWRFRRLRVRPPWEPALEGDVIDLVIDPGQAFGTGAHHTTRLCLELLLELEPAGALADWGCGTGVLAIAAARLGWDPVLACDWEAASVEATAENAAVNGVPGITVTRADLRREEGPWAPTVAANLVRPLLLEVAGAMTRPPETLIVSGLLREEADEVAAAFARHGLREADRRHGGEWAAVLLTGGG